MTANTVQLPDDRVRLRLARPNWDDPLDPSYARDQGGRWNPIASIPALYMNGDVATARMQIERLLADSPVNLDDVDGEAYLLVAATLPGAQRCADAVTNTGLRALGLPDSYPRAVAGDEIGHTVCRSIGRKVRAAGLDGIWCRSACTVDGRGRELPWLPSAQQDITPAGFERPVTQPDSSFRSC